MVVGPALDADAGADTADPAVECEDDLPRARTSRRRSLVRNATQDRAENAHRLRVLNDDARASVNRDFVEAVFPDAQPPK